jgi:hypothetical protein
MSRWLRELHAQKAAPTWSGSVVTLNDPGCVKTRHKITRVPYLDLSDCSSALLPLLPDQFIARNARLKQMVRCIPSGRSRFRADWHGRPLKSLGVSLKPVATGPDRRYRRPDPASRRRKCG